MQDSFVKPTKSIEKVHLLRRLPFFDGANVRPFLLCYALSPLAYVVFGKVAALVATNPSDKSVILFGFLLLFGLAQLLVILLPLWSLEFALRSQYKYARTIKDCTHVLIRANKNLSASMIVPLEITCSKEIFDLSSYFTDSSTAKCLDSHIAEQLVIKFRFRNREWTWDPNQQLFTKPFYPHHLTFADYIGWKGHTGEKLSREILHKAYGKNQFSIDIPRFSVLFAEHATKPFFVFQMCCVLLWCLDDYWMYSLFTGIMFVIFEGISVMQIRSSMSMMLKMGKIPTSTNHYLRNGEWHAASSDTLLPGDIIRIPSDRSDFFIPCDMLILKGTLLVNEALLTGESTPQVKHSITKCNPSSVLNNATDHQHILFGGTKILSVYAENSSEESIAFVLRTGFATEQGKLLTSIIHSSDRLTTQDRETFFFILFLLFFAILACIHVINRGWGVPTRSQWKLVLTCIRILTSVVPPELPMELSMAINNALTNLTTMQIFCTQPHRIPLAGKVDVCCFDKTGTLTCDNMILHGVTDSSGNFHPVENKGGLGVEHRDIICVLGACNSVLCIGDETAGDPMEKAAMDALGWEVKSNNLVGERKGKRSVSILARFAFESSLKRMSVIAEERGRQNSRCILLKGAPEVLEQFLVTVPANYSQTYRDFARQGFRTIALARKEIPSHVTEAEVLRYSREEAESQVKFLGFAIFQSQIKPDCEYTMKELKQSGHATVMVTGDSELTAIAVAKSVGILMKDDIPLILRGDTNGTLSWENHENQSIGSLAGDFSLDGVKNEVLCANGDAFEIGMRENPLWFRNIVPAVRVWARCTPEIKSSIMLCLKDLGHNTLFAGDGINDMAALKHADVGIAILNAASPDEAVTVDQNLDFLKDHLCPIPVPVLPEEAPSVDLQSGFFANVRATISQKQREVDLIDRQEIIRVNKLRKQGKATPLPHPTAFRLRMKLTTGLNEVEAQFETNGAPLVRLGDASIASPFTSKTSKVSAVLDIIRMGRCSLVTTLQMYRIIALNCLIGAYSMSVLYSDGVKMGDYQMVVVSILITICFLWISKAKPLPVLSPKRPFTRIFCGYVIFSILSQFFVHLLVFVGSVWLVDGVDISARVLQGAEVDDEKFKPTLLNSVNFLVYTMMTVTTFAVNYQGEPFMTPLRQNIVLRNGLIVLAGIITVLSLEIFPDFNLSMEIVPFPSVIFRAKVVALLFFDIFAAYISDRLLLRAFG
ncbi:cation-transporting ATPase [Perkinsela sp. CCAP 1560/4]|nr:cation-transporting ATPase [Perkinsela sp. CCAP 1560/4]|eukprot:KNH07107.1 cation-transporting ATPase [Perkinsela sp. CCAP 1560/4]